MKMERAPSPLLLMLLLSSLAVVCSAVEPAPITVKPDVAPEYRTINYIEEVGSCSYEVTVATSCSSPPFITGEIGVLFGDSHGNQIIEKKLSNGDRVFGSCNTDSFVLKDRPCSVQISYVYIYKDGADDWLPNSIEISGSGIKPLLFIFKSSIPRNAWFGFDLRQFPFPPPSFNAAPPLPWLSPPPPSLPWLSPPPPPSPSLPWLSPPPPPSHPLLPPPEPILPPPPKPILPPPSPPKPVLPPPSPPPPSHPLLPPPEPILPPPPKPILPPPSPPKPVLPPPPPPPSPSSSSKISGQKWVMISVILALLAITPSVILQQPRSFL